MASSGWPSGLSAFFTFIGSMGNIPLAALLYDRGVIFAGVMAFIFSDLVVLPVLRINAEYYGWKMALYIMGLLLSCLVFTSLLMHYGFQLWGLLPDSSGGKAITNRSFFKLNYGLVLNIPFIVSSAVLGWLWWRQQAGNDHHHSDAEASLTVRILQALSVLAAIWLAGGLVVKAIGLYSG